MKPTTTASSYISSKFTVNATQWHVNGDHHRVYPTESVNPSLSCLQSIGTSNGNQCVKPGDWIIDNPDGSYSVCDPATFALMWQINKTPIKAKKSVQKLINLPIFGGINVATSNESAMKSAAETIERMIGQGVLVHVNGIRGYTFPPQSIVDAENATVKLRATMEAMNQRAIDNTNVCERERFEQSLGGSDLTTAHDSWGTTVYINSSVQDKWTGWQLATIAH